MVLNPHVSSMTPGINNMNARSWGTFVLSTLKLGLLRTAVPIPQTEINSTDSNRTMILLTVQLVRSYCKNIIYLVLG